jgi:hypothetical protein
MKRSRTFASYGQLTRDQFVSTLKPAKRVVRVFGESDGQPEEELGPAATRAAWARRNRRCVGVRAVPARRKVA